VDRATPEDYEDEKHLTGLLFSGTSGGTHIIEKLNDKRKEKEAQQQQKKQKKASASDQDDFIPFGDGQVPQSERNSFSLTLLFPNRMGLKRETRSLLMVGSKRRQSAPAFQRPLGLIQTISNKR
jgi:hypothetical protein